MTRAKGRFIMRRGRALRALAVLAGVFAGAAAIPSGLASAASSGTVTETINVGVLSVTVSPSSIDLCSASTPLTFPNGGCNSPTITVTNGTEAADIDVNGANAVPADGGTNWTLCGTGGVIVGAGVPCTNGNQPGQDQYVEQTFVGNSYLAPLLDSPICDGSFDDKAEDCAATPGQSATEQIALTGPTASTDPSSTFTSSVTWTAVAQ